MKALVACLSNPGADPRPNRTIRNLNENGFIVDTFSFEFEGGASVNRNFRISEPKSRLQDKLLRLFLSFLVSIIVRLLKNPMHLVALYLANKYQLNNLRNEVASLEYDLIVVQDLQLLPIVFFMKGKAKILFDAREFYIKQYEDSLRFRLIEGPTVRYLCSEYIPRCDHCITISPSIAEAYKNLYNVEMSVIRSIPQRHILRPLATDPNKIRLVHHGLANKNRGLTKVIEIVKKLDERFTLDFYLVGSQKNIQELIRAAENCRRIRFCDPVLLDEIVPSLNSYDIGICYFEPTTFNLRHALPNKFFEFVQARLAIAIGPSPDMAEVIHNYNCGFVSEDFSVESMVATLQSLSPEQIDLAKKNSDLASRELCFEEEGKKLHAVIDRILR